MQNLEQFLSNVPKDCIFAVLSPDQIPIYPKPHKSPRAALKKARSWVTRYRQQGYYSANHERIPYDEILNSCTLAAFRNAPVPGTETAKIRISQL